MAKRNLVTSGLPYSNGDLHVGHIAGAYLPADIYVRFLRLNGEDVKFVCGSDDHGVAIMMTSIEENKTPQEVCDFYHERQKRAFDNMNIKFDIFGSTSRNPYHKEMSQNFFNRALEKGFLTKKISKQFYDSNEDMFLPDRFVEGTCKYCNTEGQNADQCENCGNLLDVDNLLSPKSAKSGGNVEVKETTHWYFELGKCQDVIEKWLGSAKLRAGTSKYVMSLLESGLKSRPMTRDLNWGIPLPVDDPDAEGKVLYVWFDAPIGYISNLFQFFKEQEGEGVTEDYWANPECDITHFIGEDNTIFHCVIWIAMLSVYDEYNLPNSVIVNKFLNINIKGGGDEKISKSKKNALWINDYIENGGNADSLRYYLTSVAPEKSRTAFNSDDMIQRYNSDLANTFGNFVNRTISFTGKHCDYKIPNYSADLASDIDTQFAGKLETTHQKVSVLLKGSNNKEALFELMELARECNRYFDEKKPWVTVKENKEATMVTLYNSMFAIKLFSICLSPFMPTKMDELSGILNCGEDKKSWSSALVPFEVGHKFNKSKILFKRIE